MDNFKEVDYGLYNYFLQKVGSQNMLLHKEHHCFEYIYIPSNEVIAKCVLRECNNNKYYILKDHKKFIRSIKENKNGNQ